jgi:nucleotide-binding universal stress UspA family protein
MAARKQIRSPLHTIIVPTDFSVTSARAMTFALVLTGQKSRVIAVHVLDPLQYRFGPPESSTAHRRQAWLSAQASMARWLQENKISDCATTIIDGEVAPAIVKFADMKRADLVVLATSARRRGARLLLGSVAEEIFRELKCPVFVLGPKTGLPKKQRACRLLFATDLEPHSLNVLSKFSEIADSLDADISVIRAVHPDIKSRTERSRIRRETRKVFEAAAADYSLRKRLKAFKVVFAHPVKAISGSANRIKADAIVMGIRGGGELSRAVTHIPWTLTHRMIAEARCPVLTIRG